MKILKHGNIELIINKRITFTCPKCNCVFEANNLEYNQKQDCHNDMYYHVSCPECGCVCIRDAKSINNIRGI